MNEFISNNIQDTHDFGSLLAKMLEEGKVICLSGELGSGKTTFTQGFLQGFGVEGPYTSPTFLIMKQYQIKFPISNFQFPNKSQISIPSTRDKIENVYHLDAYRVGTDDILNLGFEEIIGDKKNAIIIEWAERIKDIIPEDAIWIDFEWIDENKRKLIFNSQFPNPNVK